MGDVLKRAGLIAIALAGLVLVGWSSYSRADYVAYGISGGP
jgi:hypothetical protein